MSLSYQVTHQVLQLWTSPKWLKIKYGMSRTKLVCDTSQICRSNMSWTQNHHFQGWNLIFDWITMNRTPFFVRVRWTCCFCSGRASQDVFQSWWRGRRRGFPRAVQPGSQTKNGDPMWGLGQWNAMDTPKKVRLWLRRRWCLHMSTAYLEMLSFEFWSRQKPEPQWLTWRCLVILMS